LVYSVSIKEAIVFFETGKLKVNKAQFNNEFNELFNKSEYEAAFNRNIDYLRLSNKVEELKAIYYSLLYADGENAKKRFKELFGKDFEGTEEDIKKINDKAKFFIDKIKSMPKPKDSGLSFADIVTIVENSRGINVDRSMSVFEFYKIYELELKKWKNNG
jgi:hypothetical protein